MVSRNDDVSLALEYLELSWLPPTSCSAGDSLFAAVKNDLQMDYDGTSNDLRLLTIRYLRDNRDILLQFQDDCLLESAIDDYLGKMSCPGTHPGERELVALASLFNTEIYVFRGCSKGAQLYKKPRSIESGETFEQKRHSKPIRLAEHATGVFTDVVLCDSSTQSDLKDISATVRNRSFIANMPLITPTNRSK